MITPVQFAFILMVLGGVWASFEITSIQGIFPRILVGVLLGAAGGLISFNGYGINGTSENKFYRIFFPMLISITFAFSNLAFYYFSDTASLSSLFLLLGIAVILYFALLFSKSN